MGALLIFVSFLGLGLNIYSAKKSQDESDKQTAELEKLGKKKQRQDDEVLFINNATEWPTAFRY